MVGGDHWIDVSVAAGVATITHDGAYGGDPAAQVFALKDSTSTRILTVTFDSKGHMDTWIPDF